MPSSLPPAPDLVAIVREHLEAEVLPKLEGAAWFNLKVAVNLLGMVERELRQGVRAEGEEAERLTALVGAEGSAGDKNRRLALAIRDGTLAADDKALLAHLRRSLEAALAVNNPRWLRD